MGIIKIFKNFYEFSIFGNWPLFQIPLDSTLTLEAAFAGEDLVFAVSAGTARAEKTPVINQKGNCVFVDY